MLKIPGKIPVLISPFFWALAFIIGWLNTSSLPGTLIWALIILGSVLIHEFGHALTAIAFGQKVQVELVGFGGVTKRKGTGKLKLWKEFIIVINGPLAGFSLAFFAYWIFKSLSISHPQSLSTYAAEITFYVNFFWTILNLIPVQPLDGGKLLSIILESLFGIKGTKIALFISLLLAAALGIFFFIQKDFFIGSLFMLFTFESYKSWKESLSITEEDQNFMIQHLFRDAEEDLHQGHVEKALKNFQGVRGLTKGGIIYQAATENIAHLLVQKKELKQAYDLLKPLGKHLSVEGMSLLHQLAYSQGYWQEAATLGNRVYHHHPHYEVAVINALSHAALGHVRPAIGWIQSAIHDGVPNIHQEIAKKEFDPIRVDPLFRELQDKIRQDGRE